MKKYLVKIEESVLPQSYTFDQLIEAGLLDNVDDKIKVKLEGDSVWITARDYPFSDVEISEENESSSAHTVQHISPRQVTTRPRQYHAAKASPSTTSQHRTSEMRRTLPVERTHQRPVTQQPKTPSILSTWNWGAFCLSWIWSVCNGIYWPLIMIALNFIPYIGVLCSLGICIYLGLKGNEMAWVNAKQKGTDVYSFESTQGDWNMLGLVLFLIGILLSLIYVIYTII